MRKLRKKGNLLIPVLLFLLILTGLLTILTLTQTILQQYKASRIIYDYNRLSTAIKSFQSSFSYWPGDVSYSSLTGPLANASVKADTLYTETNYNNTTHYGQSGNGIIGSVKSTLTWLELGVSGILKDSSINYTKSLNGVGIQTLSYNYLVGNNMLPESSFDSNLAWTFSLDLANQGAPSYTVPYGSAIYNSTYGVYNTMWSGMPKLTLYKWGSATYAGYLDLTNASGDISAVSPSLAFIVDQKIDDGFPYGPRSIVVGDGYQVSSSAGSKCNNIGVLYSAATQQSQFTGTTAVPVKYIHGSTIKGCVMTFRF
ncbi:hypothetical protein [Candidatus Deianiraea vastatrix]|uniref:Uncharacterized protein n=1 Tax=Candidatus Deianiraea vastatrix TaxID=2163644 RepID=A0A5B8XDG9_9RICK|nr:hypothetical protein [Candidatus Deianiraea vastatrix]QED23368.1 hypothetical protein Deia_00573 [Candidatus Deianiraea vastatrix]